MLSFLSVFSPSLQFLITLWSKSHKGSLRNIFPNTFVVLLILFFMWDFSECQDVKVFSLKINYVASFTLFVSLVLGKLEACCLQAFGRLQRRRAKRSEKELGVGTNWSPADLWALLVPLNLLPGTDWACSLEAIWENWGALSNCSKIGSLLSL